MLTAARRPATDGNTRRRVLLVEDDGATARALSEILDLEGFEVRAVRTGADAIDALHGFTPDVVIVDLQLPIMDGRSFIELYRRRVRPAASVIVMSGRADGPAIAQSVGADGFLRKPLEIETLLRTIAVTINAA